MTTKGKERAVFHSPQGEPLHSDKTWEDLVIAKYGKINAPKTGYKGLMHGVFMDLPPSEPFPDGLLADTLERMKAEGTLVPSESKMFGYELELRLTEENSKNA